MSKKKGKTEIEPVSVSGKLFFRPVEARSLKGGKKIETYAKVYLDTERKFKTDCIKKTTDPKWEEQPRLLALQEDVPVHEVRFSIYKKDFIGESNLGTVHIPIHTLVNGIPQDNWYALENKKGATDRGEIHLQLMYLELNDDISSQLEEFCFPLHTFAEKRKFELFTAVLEQIQTPPEIENVTAAHEWNIDAINGEGKTALHVAAALGRIRFASALLAAGADVSITDEDGCTALHRAAEGGAEEIVSAILERDDAVNNTNKEGWTPLHFAAKGNHPRAISLLTENGAQPNIADEICGDTPLHVALKACAKLALGALCEAGADIFKENNMNVAPWKMSLNLDIVDEGTKKHFFSAANVVTEREFELKKKFKNRLTYGADELFEDWTKNDQWCIRSDTEASVFVILHYEDPLILSPQPMEKAGFLVLKPPRKDFEEVTYLHDLIDYGKIDPFTLEIQDDDQGRDFVVIPFCKNESITEKWYVVAYTDSDDVEIVKRKKWPAHVSLDSAWEGETAGGCIENTATCMNNPKFKLTIPAEKDIHVTVLLQQERSPQDVLRYQVQPYKSHIGFYIYTSDMSEMVGQCKQMKNAREISEIICLDGTAATEYVVLPATYKPEEEHKFTVSIFSEAEGCTLTAL